MYGAQVLVPEAAVTNLVVSSIVLGAYLVALVAHGHFDRSVGFVIVGLVVMWMVPVARNVARRRRRLGRPS